MTSIFIHPLVSGFERTDGHSRDMHEHRGRSHYRYKEMTDFVDAVCEALGGVSHYNQDNNTAYIYRPGDAHVLGAIGFEDLRLRKTANEKRVYYVRTNNINNPKIDSNYWQHKTVSTDKLATAVKLAVKHLVPISVGDAIDMTYQEVIKAVATAKGIINVRIRSSLSKLLGFSVYTSNHLSTPIFAEMRNITFASEELNNSRDELCRHMDELAEFDNYARKGITYVAFSDNYGQPVVDIAHLDTEKGKPMFPPSRVVTADIPEWVQGRVAVLNMVAPETYVHGVGMRFDDRVFYISGE